MAETHDSFEARIKALGAKNRKVAHGYGTRIGHDGLITLVPKRRRRGVPWKLLLMFVIGFMGFKALLVTSVGPITYNQRLAKLADGTLVEQAGAKMLSIDPVTAQVVRLRGPVLR